MGAHKPTGKTMKFYSHVTDRNMVPMTTAFSRIFFVLLLVFLVTVFWCLYILFFWWLPGVVVAAVGSLISPCSSSLTKAVCSACYFGQFTTTWLLIAVNWRRKRRGKSSFYPFFSGWLISPGWHSSMQQQQSHFILFLLTQDLTWCANLPDGFLIV